MQKEISYKSVVKILSRNPELQEVWGKIGEVVGRSDTYEDGSVDWGVFVFDTEQVWQIHESDLTLET
ncbi:hypothetical protein EP331_09865 [bacterium]|nr:MAG: hypothetical protein EP331_09865 [bacterium]